MKKKIEEIDESIHVTEREYHYLEVIEEAFSHPWTMDEEDKPILRAERERIIRKAVNENYILNIKGKEEK